MLLDLGIIDVSGKLVKVITVVILEVKAAILDKGLFWRPVILSLNVYGGLDHGVSAYQRCIVVLGNKSCTVHDSPYDHGDVFDTMVSDTAVRLIRSLVEPSFRMIVKVSVRDEHDTLWTRTTFSTNSAYVTEQLDDRVSMIASVLVAYASQNGRDQGK